LGVGVVRLHQHGAGAVQLPSHTIHPSLLPLPTPPPRRPPTRPSGPQGFASGDLEADAAALRLFASSPRADGRPLEMLLAQSFAKNMGL
jgi:hypothetical protein